MLKDDDNVTLKSDFIILESARYSNFVPAKMTDNRKNDKLIFLLMITI